MAGIKALSKVNMVSLVRDILHGKDLSQVTPRIVREEVILRLGDEVTSDYAALKSAVKCALDVVLTDGIDEREPDTIDTVDTMKSTAREKDDIHSNQLNGATAPEGDEGVGEDADPKDEAEQDPHDNGYSRGDEDEEQAIPRKWAEPAMRESQQRPRKRARGAIEENNILKSEKDLKRLKKICRRLGCAAPPSRQKGSTMREKCSSVLSYMRSKGVMDTDPTRLRKEDIDAHRTRIERERDMEGLDVSNIIEEEGRPKRRVAAVKAASNEEPLSDLSVLDSSEKSEDDDEEFAVSDGDSE